MTENVMTTSNIYCLDSNHGYSMSTNQLFSLMPERLQTERAVEKTFCVKYDKLASF